MIEFKKTCHGDQVRHQGAQISQNSKKLPFCQLAPELDRMYSKIGRSLLPKIHGI